MAWHDEHMMMHAWERDVRCCSKTTPKGFEPLRAEPNAFLVHHIPGHLLQLALTTGLLRPPRTCRPRQRRGESALACVIQHPATVHLVTMLDAVMGSTKPNSCGVRAHALTDWRLKPAP